MSLEEIEASLIRQETTEYLRDLTLYCFWRRSRPSPVCKSRQTPQAVRPASARMIRAPGKRAARSLHGHHGS